MRVLQFSLGYPPALGGMEVVVRELTEGLAARGHELKVITFDPPAPPDDDPRVVRSGLRLALARRDPRAVLGCRRELAREVEAFAPDVVVGHFGEGTTCVAMAELPAHVPAVLAVHNVLEPWMDVTPTSTMGRVAARSRLVAVSPSVAASLEVLGPATVITNGISADVDVRPEPAGGPVLVCLGRLVPQKGFDVAIAAMAEVRRHHRDAVLRIVGDGPERAALAAAAAAVPGVELVGPVPAGTAPEVFAGAHLVVMPSRFEGHPIVAIEAAWAGRAVVGTRAPGLVDAVEHGRTGVLVDRDDPAALAGAIVALLDDPAGRARLGAAARARAEVSFGCGPMVDAYEALLSEVVACAR